MPGRLKSFFRDPPAAFASGLAGRTKFVSATRGILPEPPVSATQKTHFPRKRLPVSPGRPPYALSRGPQGNYYYIWYPPLGRKINLFLTSCPPRPAKPLFAGPGSKFNRNRGTNQALGRPPSSIYIDAGPGPGSINSSRPDGPPRPARPQLTRPGTSRRGSGR